MELSAETAGRYLRHAYAQMLTAADRLGEELVNRRPHGPGTNSVAALIVHCAAVAPWWLGHVALGDPTQRDRESEFEATATIAELHALVAASLAASMEALRRLEAGEGSDGGGRQFLLDGDASDAGVVIHVIEELFQHLGHIDLTVDALTA